MGTRQNPAEPQNSSTNSGSIGNEVSYHENTTHISRSMLATFAESPRKFEAAYVTRTIEADDESDALKIGTGTHAVCLDDVIELDKIVIIPQEVLASNGHRRGKAWEQFEFENACKTLLLPKQFELVKTLSDRLRSLIGGFLDNPLCAREQEIYFSGYEVPLRAKLDIVVPTKAGVLVIDLKTAVDVSPRGFERAVRDRRLWLQDAHYSLAATKCYGQDTRFLFAVVEKSVPYRTRIYELPEYVREVARQRHEELCHDLARRMESGDWSEPGEGEIVELQINGSLV